MLIIQPFYLSYSLLQNEEWIDYDEGGVDSFVGLSAHALDINTKTLYAVGAVTSTGFEKIVEINPMHEDYIVLAPSGCESNSFLSF